MDSYFLREHIISHLRGLSSINFQYALNPILTIYYKKQNQTFEMPSHLGGDKKNDGWVKEIGVFYQSYSPVQYSNSFKKDLQRKFSEDLDGLLNLVATGNWGGNISEFVFIVNTRDMPLPEDSENYYTKTHNELQNKYRIFFNFCLENLDYINIKLSLLDKDELTEIASRLKVLHTYNSNIYDAKAIYNFISRVSSHVASKLVDAVKWPDYKRISTPRKISINDLDDYRNKINARIDHLDIALSKTLKTLCSKHFFAYKTYIVTPNI